MNYVNFDYVQLLREIMQTGEEIQTRNSKCKRIIAKPLAFVQTPLISIRKTAWKNALREWEWFMSGSNDINTLAESVRHWWSPWADESGKIKYNYSRQFRSYGEIYDGEDCRGKDLYIGGYDQIEEFIKGIKQHPNSRRNMITTWNTEQMNMYDCSITNCHGTVIQAFIERGELCLLHYQRSTDVICGMPHNLIQYWAFLQWIAYRTGNRPGTLIYIGGDVHIYEAHYPIVDEIIQAYNSGARPAIPELVYTPTSPEFKADDFSLNGEYEPTVTTRAEMII